MKTEGHICREMGNTTDIGTADSLGFSLFWKINIVELRVRFLSALSRLLLLGALFPLGIQKSFIKSKGKLPWQPQLERGYAII